MCGLQSQEPTGKLKFTLTLNFMLIDVINFVKSRTGLTDRDAILREIRLAWREIWNLNDIPNSIFEITMAPVDTTARISLPHYVGVIRAVKKNNQQRVELNTPRPYYQDIYYFQEDVKWRILGISPIQNSVANATTVNVSISEAETEQFHVVFIGPTDNAVLDREIITFQPGETDKIVTKRFTDFQSITKDAITKTNVNVTGANEEILALIPNNDYEARNTVIQITDDCTTCCSSCKCYDILYKLPPPTLYYDEQVLPYEEVVLPKIMEWLTLPLEGDANTKKAVMYADKTDTLLRGSNQNQSSISKKLDIARSRWHSRIYDKL